MIKIIKQGLTNEEIEEKERIKRELSTCPNCGYGEFSIFVSGTRIDDANICNRCECIWTVE